jgi:OOP family OmpA-OmpF porin
MLRKSFSCVIGIGLVLLLCSVVSAQVKPGTFSVTPYLGGYLFDKDQRLATAPVKGISLGYNFTKYFGMEASGEYISTEYDLYVPDSRSTRVVNYRLDGVFNLLPDGRLVPFIFAGFGGQIVDYPATVSDRNAFSVDCGAGLKFFFTDWLALRADVRRIYVFDNSMKDLEFTMGVSFSFGGAGKTNGSRDESMPEMTRAPAAKE